MKRIDLEIYKDFKIYFNLFDVLIKNTSANIETFLEGLYISPSSYRRAKISGNKIGNQILIDLSTYFQYKICSDELIDEIEKHLNQIYFDMYYKDYKNYDNHMQWIEEKINDNLLIFPLFKVMKLFLIMNSGKSPNVVLNENRNLYQEIREYVSFYDGLIYEILEIFDVSFRGDLEETVESFRYKNEMAYHTLAARYAFMEKHIESLYYCRLLKESLIKDENYRRIYYLNNIILANYNNLCKFVDAYELEVKQMASLKANEVNDSALLLTKKHYIVSCLGLKKYKEVILSLKDVNPLQLTEGACYLIAYYNVDKELYKKELDYILNNQKDQKIINFFTLLNDILTTKSKKTFEKIYDYNINKSVIKILKKEKKIID